ncbi:MAG: tail fiber domain-containing protein [Saprospiraceae bacterium]|nr:tail fiber domain-containing protein [Saprospiraceae bacterium]
MKQIITMALALCCAATLFAQTGAPQGFNYQAVPRKADGSTFPEGANLTVRFLLRENTADGPVRYAEEQTLTVSPQGAVSATIGGGSAVANLPHDMGAVNWGAFPHFLAVAADMDGKGNFEDFGASQLLSVPYALYAQTAGNNTFDSDGPEANINGSGTTNFIPKFTGSSSIGNSILREANGKIGIGVNPSWRLHVSGGDIKATGDVIVDGAVAFNSSMKLGLGYGGIACTAPFISSQTYFNLGSSTRKWGALWAVNGTIQTSDIRFKKDIQPIGYGLKEVMKLRPVSYQWRDENLGRKTHLGFVAQELKTVLDEVVHDEEYIVTDVEKGTGEWKPTTSLGVAYSEIIPVAIAAIQEQQAQIEALKAEVEQLKKLLTDKK